MVFTELESGRTTEYRYASTDRTGLEEAVGAVVDRMAAGTYRPRRTYDPSWCERCPGFRGLCPIRPKRPGGAG